MELVLCYRETCILLQSSSSSGYEPYHDSPFYCNNTPPWSLFEFIGAPLSQTNFLEPFGILGMHEMYEHIPYDEV